MLPYPVDQTIHDDGEKDFDQAKQIVVPSTSQGLIVLQKSVDNSDDSDSDTGENPDQDPISIQVTEAWSKSEPSVRSYSTESVVKEEDIEDSDVEIIHDSMANASKADSILSMTGVVVNFVTLPKCVICDHFFQTQLHVENHLRTRHAVFKEFSSYFLFQNLELK